MCVEETVKAGGYVFWAKSEEFLGHMRNGDLDAFRDLIHQLPLSVYLPFSCRLPFELLFSLWFLLSELGYDSGWQQQQQKFCLQLYAEIIHQCMENLASSFLFYCSRGCGALDVCIFFLNELPVVPF